MAKVRFVGSNPVQASGYASVQTKASLGPEMTPIKVMQKELCDGFLHVFNPGEERKIECDCPDMRHIRQFLGNEYFEVSLSLAEKIRLARIEGKEAPKEE